MKNIFLLFLACLFYSSFVAQHKIPAAAAPAVAAANQKHEIGMNFFSLFYQSGFDGPQTTMYLDPGIYYKLHLNKNVIRFSMDYHQNNLNEIHINKIKNQFADHIVTKKGQIAIGYQRDLGKKKLVPFVYGDVFVSLGRTEFAEDGIVFFARKSKAYGGSVGGGLRYKITRHVSMSYEFGLGMSIDPRLGFSYPVYELSICPIKQLGVSFTF